jgi:hypothetical protein
MDPLRIRDSLAFVQDLKKEGELYSYTQTRDQGTNIEGLHEF